MAIIGHFLEKIPEPGEGQGNGAPLGRQLANRPLAAQPVSLPQLLHPHADEADEFASGVLPPVQEGHQEFHGFKG